MAILNSLMMTATGSGDTCEALEGTLWTWGRGSYYLGHDNLTDYSSPTQVGTDTDWTNKVGAFGGYDHHIIKTDGTLWAWGKNNSGGVGDGTTTARSSPVQIGSDTDWAQVSTGSAKAAIRTDGTLWTWGDNSYGQCGLGDTTERSSPTQVGSGTDWASVQCAKSSYYTMALKTDGTLWAFGRNYMGQLGDNSQTNRSSPVQAGSATNWIAFQADGVDSSGWVRALASV